MVFAKYSLNQRLSLDLMSLNRDCKYIPKKISGNTLKPLRNGKARLLIFKNMSIPAAGFHVMNEKKIQSALLFNCLLLY